MDNTCIIMTGLPGSGKSTTGKLIAGKLKLPVLDKDDYLEKLFEERGIGNLTWRQELSRESDGFFIQDAKEYRSVVLVSHWRPRSSSSTSGTPTEWLEKHYARIIEVYCACPVEIAAERFIGRQRHPGHRDDLKLPQEVIKSFKAYGENLPLNLGKLEVISTTSRHDLDCIMSRIQLG